MLTTQPATRPIEQRPWHKSGSVSDEASPGKTEWFEEHRREGKFQAEQNLLQTIQKRKMSRKARCSEPRRQVHTEYTTIYTTHLKSLSPEFGWPSGLSPTLTSPVYTSMPPTAPPSPEDSGSESGSEETVRYTMAVPPSPPDEWLDDLVQQRPRARSVAIMERCSCKEWDKLNYLENK